MSPTVVRWTTAGHPPAADQDVPARFAPVRIAVGARVVVAAAGEPVDLPEGPFEARVAVPGFLPLAVQGPTPPPELYFDTHDLRPDPRAAAPVDGPRGLAIDVVPWDAAPVGAAFEAVHCDGALQVRQSAGLPASAGLRVASPVTPYRLLALPPAATAEPHRVAWYRAPDATRRPRVEPLDGGGRLIMEYLLAGSADLAAAAARAVDRDRGAADPLAWVTASYTQLLIGYAFALARDTGRLSDWCLRTGTTTELGGDGLVLAAEAAWQRRDLELARRLLARTGGAAQPTMTFGGELAVRLATLLAVRTYGRDARRGRRLNLLRSRRFGHLLPPRYRAPESIHADRVLDDQLARLNTDGMRVLSEADAGSAGLSVPRTGTSSLDLSAAPYWRRLRWRLRFVLTRWRHTAVRARVLRFPIDPTVQEVPMDRNDERQRTAPDRTGIILAILSLAALPILLALTYVDRLTDALLPLFMLGAITAVVLVGIGATAAATVFQRRLREVETRARQAEVKAEHYQSAAMRGRALLAVVLVEEQREGDPHAVGELVARNRRIARELFDLPAEDDLPVPRSRRIVQEVPADLDE
ncbi:hypothetical protein [Dactylosporangium sp. CS-033363]|uniref:hypothetical protein n=1 Tax=Dactylosporangium sp. CS-033363 TaxID=3239935 RepID=UPI003D9221A4